MKLGLNLGYFSSAQEIHDGIELAKAAEGLGYDAAWVAEAYGSDAPTVMSAIATSTTTLEVGSAIMQIPARSAAMTAMTAATLDSISGGRARLGLGVSGPQVSEGWHGVRYDSPLGRTEEYISIVRQALSRSRVAFEGKHFTLPLPDGPGKSLMIGIHPVRAEIPIYLAAVGPKNLALTGRIADGWHAIFFDAQTGREHIETIRAAAVAAERDADKIDYAATVSVAVGPDQETAARQVRPNAALYIGGMGSKKVNFYHGIATAMGYENEADDVQAKFLSRDYAGAAAAVPLEFLTRTCLLGTVDEIAAGLEKLAGAGITSTNVGAHGKDLAARIKVLETTVQAAKLAGVLG